MRMKQIKKSLSLIFCMMLIVAMALFTSGCNDKVTETPKAEGVEDFAQGQENADSVEERLEAESQTEEMQPEGLETVSCEVTVLGEGETTFLFTVVDKDGAETVFEIHTDKEIVGDALLELGLIAGEDGDYGLFVKSVNGIVADYEVDKTYWAFYVNGEYAMSGVDTTTIEENTSYMFKVEK